MTAGRKRYLNNNDFTLALAACQSEEQVPELLARAARELGFDYFAYGLRTPVPVSNPRTLILSNYPAAWQQRYAQQNFVAADPTVAHGMRSVLPLVWSEQLLAQSGQFWEEARSHGLNVGWAQSAFDAQGAVGMLTLAREHEQLSAAELRSKEMQMSWLAHATHTAMARLASGRLYDPAPVLTAREAEVLRWTADGKTSGEIAQFTGISERTVNFHVNNAIEKLGVANKTAAAVKAAVLRLL